MLKQPCCFCYYWGEKFMLWALLGWVSPRSLNSRECCLLVSGTEWFSEQGSRWGLWRLGWVFVLSKCHHGESLLSFQSQVLSWAGRIGSAFPSSVQRNLRGVKTCSEKKKRKRDEIIASTFRRYSELPCCLLGTSQVFLSYSNCDSLRWGSHEQLSQSYLIMEEFGKSCIK